MPSLKSSAVRLYRRVTVGPEFIQTRYGTGRGLARLGLSRIGYWRGAYASFEPIYWERVSRLVFVCRGNICRSPYAERRAFDRGLVSHSFGIRAVAGSGADVQAMAVAQRRGIALEQHRARSVEDFASQPGDLLIAMEPDQARELLARFGGAGVQVTLLGLWSRPPRPHLYDPKDMSDRYFDTVFDVIDDAIRRMQSMAAKSHAS